jgi:hypothetical protein
VNRSAATTADLALAVTTRISTVPAVCAGDRTVILLAELTVKLLTQLGRLQALQASVGRWRLLAVVVVILWGATLAWLLLAG